MQTNLSYKKNKTVNEVPAFSKAWWLSYIKVLLGATIIAFGYVTFFIPFKIIPGGLFGFSTVIGYLTGWPIGMISLTINIPLLIWGIRALGNSFGAKTILAMIWASLAVDGFTYLTESQGFTDDKLVSAVFGGVLIGLGVALTLREEATTGGTDTLAKILSHYFNVSVSRFVLIIDGSIVILGLIAFKDLSLAPYAIVAVFSISKTIDSVLGGFNNKNVLMIISEYHQDIRQYILTELDRGGTYINGHGLFFTEKEKQIILTAISRKEMVALENYIKVIDPEAFLMVLPAHEVKGSGFNPLNQH
ncbi:YitT family protein [Limibacter armeniacum]|uniref:YitT family protein n=1 Tax=Limibacter armeniacum TaxID=466084 RepID=UPI002FE5A4EF